MVRTVKLQVPQGNLMVEQVFQEILGFGGEVLAVTETTRTLYRDGQVVPWSADDHALHDLAEVTLARLPSPVPGVPVLGATP